MEVYSNLHPHRPKPILTSSPVPQLPFPAYPTLLFGPALNSPSSRAELHGLSVLSVYLTIFIHKSQNAMASHCLAQLLLPLTRITASTVSHLPPLLDGVEVLVTKSRDLGMVDKGFPTKPLLWLLTTLFCFLPCTAGV